ncbi:hypothetical protein VTJ49DRAFT_3965 [Mycothermus thermophilus]|uniref:Kinetochore protein Sos7 coiled-coil domain-containing protein n=1 Tax=Humicola insolens TaxID=85995 RepID=A0ABR3V6H4_HUMIN
MAPLVSPEAAPDPRRVASVLRELQSTSSPDDYTILKLSEPITSAAATAYKNNDGTGNPTPAPRTSDVSTSSLDTGPTPSSLDADLQHYRELFAKLRFSYVEQVTKEKFIRAIVGDPPVIVSAQEIAELEGSNAEAKTALKQKKEEVEALIKELEGRGKGVVERYEKVRQGLKELEGLPEEVERLEREVAALRETQRKRMEVLGLGGSGSGEGGEMALPLGKTRELVEERRAKLVALERQLEAVNRQVPSKKKELERIKAEVAALEKKRTHSTAAAREAKRRKEGAQAGGEDELEARGRWYRASEAVLREVLDLKG